MLQANMGRVLGTWCVEAGNAIDFAAQVTTVNTVNANVMFELLANGQVVAQS